MGFVKFSLLVALAFMTSLSFAAPIPHPIGTSLKNALNQLNVVVPLRHDVYPFEFFSASPNARTIAVVISPDVLPDNSNLENEAVIIDVSNRTSNVVGKVKALPDERFKSMYAGQLQFLSDQLVRVQFIGPAADLNLKRPLRTYNFFNLKTKEQFSIESKLPFTGISDVRSFGEKYYLVRHIENGTKVNSTVLFDAVTGEFKVLDQPSDEVARELRYAVDEPGEEVWRVSKDNVVVYIEVKNRRSQNAYTYVIGPVGASLVPGHDGNILDKDGMFVINGSGSRVMNWSDFIEYSTDGETLDAEWPQLDREQIEGPFYQMEGFLVADFSNHPYHGWVKLTPGKNEIEMITNPYFHLRRYEVHANKITGIDEFDPLTRDISFYSIQLGASIATSNASGASQPPDRRLQVVPVPQSLPVLSTADNHRFLFVQLTVDKLVIIDTQHPNVIEQSISLLDQDFKILHVSESETLLHYPKLKKVVSYERPTFEQLRTMEESECEHLLTKRL